MKYITLNIQETQQNPNENKKKIQVHHNQLLNSNNNEKILKAARETIYYTQGKNNLNDCGFSAEKSEGRRTIFLKCSKEMHRIPYPAKISFRNEGKTTTFSDKGK